MTETDNKNAGDILQAVNAKYASANREANSLKIRLETESIKEKISSFLLGKSKVYVYDDTTKQIIPKSIDTGVAKVNMEGYQTIMTHVESIVNKSTVMGNFEDQRDLYDYLQRIRRPFSKNLWINMNKYGIRSTEFNQIINDIYALIEPFMTRTVGDGERATIRETTIQHDRVMSGDSKISLNPMNLFKR